MLKPWSILSITLKAYWFLFLSLTGIIFWTLNKGIDFTDESSSMLTFLSAQENSLNVCPIYPIIAHLTAFLEPGFVFFRALRLVLLLLSSAVFAFGFVRWAKVTLQIPLLQSMNFILPITGIVTFLSYSIFCALLTYNSLAHFFIQVIIGFILYSFSKDPMNELFKRKLIFVYACIGILFGWLLVVKFSSAILLFLLFLFTHLIHHSKNKFVSLKTAMIHLSVMLLGLGIFLLVMTLLYKSPIALYKEIELAMPFIPDHGFSHLFTMYLDDLKMNFVFFIFKHPVFLIGSFCVWIGLRFDSKILFFLMNVSAFLGIIADTIINKYYRSGIDYYDEGSALSRLLLLFCLILVILVFIDPKTRKKNNSRITNKTSLLSVLLFLLSFPFICSFGTNNPLFIQVTQFQFSWAILFILFFSLLFSIHPSGKFILAPLVFLLILNFTSETVWGLVYSPYRQNSPLTEHTYSVTDLPKGKNLKFDLNTSIFLQEAIDKMKKHHVVTLNKPIISIYNFPGLTFLLGAYSPGRSWYYDDGYQNNSTCNCYFVRNSSMQHLDQSIIMVESEFVISQEFLSCLNYKGIHFPEQFDLVDTITKPDGKGKIYLFLPKDRI